MEITLKQKIFIAIIIIVFIIAAVFTDERMLILGTFLLGIFVMTYVEHEDNDENPPTQFKCI